MKRKFSDVFYYILLFVLIFSTDTFVVFANRNSIWRTMFQIILGIFALYVAVKNTKYSKKSIRFWLLLVTCVICTSIFRLDFSNGNLIKIILLTIGMVIANGIDIKYFKKAYVDVMMIICISSIFTYILSYIIYDYGLLPIMQNTSNTRMVFFGLSNISLVSGIHRNYGPFWEPGVYSIYLSIAVLFCLQQELKITRRVLIMFIGIMTTISTSGYVMIVILLGYYLFGNVGKLYAVQHKWIRYLAASSIVCVTVFLIVFNDSLNKALLSKLNINNYEYVSTMARISSITGNIKIWMSYPIFGVGPTKLQMVFENYLLSRGYLPNANTNGLLIMFSMYGMIFGMCGIYGIYKLSKELDSSKLGFLIVLVLFVSILFTEPLTTSCIFNIIIYYGLVDHSDYYNRIRDGRKLAY